MIMMVSLKQVNEIMLKIFRVMEKLNEFSNEMTRLGISPDYGRDLREPTKKMSHCKKRRRRR